MDLNNVTLTGTLERDPITRFQETGTQQVSFTLRVDEAGPAGQLFKLYVPCEAYGQAGELAGELNAGASVLVAGKLKWTAYTGKDGTKKTRLAVLARLVKVLALAAVEAAVETSRYRNACSVTKQGEGCESMPRPRLYATNAERQCAYRQRKQVKVYHRHQKMEWATPPEFFDTLDAEFHFTVDVAAQPICRLRGLRRPQKGCYGERSPQ